MAYETLEFIYMQTDFCPHCKEALAKLKEVEAKQEKNCYASGYLRGEKKGQPVPAFILRPDYNHAGHITHWHLEYEGDESKQVKEGI